MRAFIDTILPEFQKSQRTKFLRDGVTKFTLDTAAAAMHNGTVSDSFAQGLLLQASLILALGAQNVFVLNAGLRKQRHLLVALVSAICDTLLVFVGIFGVSAIFVRLPIFKTVLGIIGVAFLGYYGAKKLKESRAPVAFGAGSPLTIDRKQVVLASLGFSLLNPHVYLDTVVLIGGYSSRFADLKDRILFGAGASTTSTLWFFGLSALASSASRVLNSPKAQRVISLISGIILIGLAIKLGSEVLDWATHSA